MHRTLPASRGRHGFTLVEAIVVLVVLSILVSIAAVAFVTIRKNATDSAGSPILGAVQAEARKIATDHGYSYPSDITAELSSGMAASGTTFTTAPSRAQVEGSKKYQVSVGTNSANPSVISYALMTTEYETTGHCLIMWDRTDAGSTAATTMRMFLNTPLDGCTAMPQCTAWLDQSSGDLSAVQEVPGAPSCPTSATATVAAPRCLSATPAGNTSATLSWSPPASTEGVDHYTVYRYDRSPDTGTSFITNPTKNLLPQNAATGSDVSRTTASVSASPPVTVAVSNDTAWEHTWAFKSAVPAATSSGTPALAVTPVAVTAATPYTFSVSVARSADGSPVAVRPQIRWLQASGAPSTINPVSTIPATVLASSWSRASVSATSPSDAATAQVEVVLDTTTSGLSRTAYVYSDGLMLESGTTASTVTLPAAAAQASVGVATTSYTFTGLTPGHTYTFYAEAANLGGTVKSSLSEFLAVQGSLPSATMVPPAPASAAVTDTGDGALLVSWTPATGATSYKVVRARTGSPTEELMVNITSAAAAATPGVPSGRVGWIDSGSQVGFTYTYRIVPVTSATPTTVCERTPAFTGDGTPTTVTSDSQVAPPVLSADPVASPVSPAVLHWTVPVALPPGVEAAYLLDRQELNASGPAGPWLTTCPDVDVAKADPPTCPAPPPSPGWNAASATTYTDTTVSAGRRYRYRVRITTVPADSAFAVQTSLWSNIVTVDVPLDAPVVTSATNTPVSSATTVLTWTIPAPSRAVVDHWQIEQRVLSTDTSSVPTSWATVASLVNNPADPAPRTWTHSPAVTGTTAAQMEYRVTAIRTMDAPPNFTSTSNVAQVSIAAPTLPATSATLTFTDATASGASDDGVITFTAVPGANAYWVYGAPQSEPWTPKPRFTSVSPHSLVGSYLDISGLPDPAIPARLGVVVSTGAPSYTLNSTTTPALGDVPIKDAEGNPLTYRIWVVPVVASGTVATSASATTLGPAAAGIGAPTVTPLAAPTVDCTQASPDIAVSWTDVPGAIGYQLYRYPAGSVWPTPVAGVSVSGTSYTDTVATGVSYTYTVVANSAYTSSPASAPSNQCTILAPSTASLGFVDANSSGAADDGVFTFTAVPGANAYWVYGAPASTPRTAKPRFSANPVYTVTGSFSDAGAEQPALPTRMAVVTDTGAPSYTLTSATTAALADVPVLDGGGNPISYRLWVVPVIATSPVATSSGAAAVGPPAAGVGTPSVVVTDPDAPTPTCTVGTSDITVSWDPVASATSYTLYRYPRGMSAPSPVGGSTVSTTSFSDASSGVGYTYTVVAHAGGRSSPVSVATNECLRLAAPTVTLSFVDNGATGALDDGVIGFTGVPGATAYWVYGAPQTVPWTPQPRFTASSPFSVAGSYSDLTGLPDASAPARLAVVTSTGANSYTLDATAAPSLANVASQDALKNPITYRIWVVPVQASDPVATATTATAVGAATPGVGTPTPAPPAAPTPTCAATLSPNVNAITVSWAAVPNATSYTLYRYAHGSAVASPANGIAVSGVTYRDSAPTGTAFTYEMVTRSGPYSSALSGATGSCETLAASTATLDFVDAGGDGAKNDGVFTFTSVPGATAYWVYGAPGTPGAAWTPWPRFTPTSPFTLAGSYSDAGVSQPTTPARLGVVTDTGAGSYTLNSTTTPALANVATRDAAGTAISYRLWVVPVIASPVSGVSASSAGPAASGAATPNVPAPVAPTVTCATTVSATVNTIDVSWSAVPGATGYTLYRYPRGLASASPPAGIAVSGASFTDTAAAGANVGTGYTYTVVATTVFGSSVASAPSGECLLLAPSAAELSFVDAAGDGAANDGVLTFDAVTGANAYWIYGDPATVPSTPQPRFNASSPFALAGSYTDAGDTAAALPARLAVVASSPDAPSYTLTSDDVPALANLTPGTAYRLWVVPVAANPTSGTVASSIGWPAAGVGTPPAGPPPPPSAPTPSCAVGTSTIAVTWPAVPGASGYTVFRYPRGSTAPSPAGGTTVATTTFLDSSSGVGYTYKVSTRAGTAVSALSNPTQECLRLVASTATLSFVDNGATGAKDDGVFTFTDVPGATGYWVYGAPATAPWTAQPRFTSTSPHTLAGSYDNLTGLPNMTAPERLAVVADSGAGLNILSYATIAQLANVATVDASGPIPYRLWVVPVEANPITGASATAVGPASFGAATPTPKPVPPPTVTCVNTVSANAAGITVSWTATPDATGYTLYRYPRGSSTADAETPIGAGVTSYADDAPTGVNYTYTVVSNTALQSSAPSAPSGECVALAATDATLGFVDAQSSGAVDDGVLTFDAVPGANAYWLYGDPVNVPVSPWPRFTSPAPFTLAGSYNDTTGAAQGAPSPTRMAVVTSTGADSYTVTSAQVAALGNVRTRDASANLVPYRFWVVPVVAAPAATATSATAMGPAAPAAAVPTPAPVSAPTVSCAANLTASSNTIHVVWTKSASATGYTVFRYPRGSATPSPAGGTPVSGTSYVDPAPTGIGYTYTVVASAGTSTSAPSAPTSECLLLAPTTPELRFDDADGNGVKDDATVTFSDVPEASAYWVYGVPKVSPFTAQPRFTVSPLFSLLGSYAPGTGAPAAGMPTRLAVVADTATHAVSYRDTPALADLPLKDANGSDITYQLWVVPVVGSAPVASSTTATAMGPAASAGATPFADAPPVVGMTVSGDMVFAGNYAWNSFGSHPRITASMTDPVWAQPGLMTWVITRRAPLTKNGVALPNPTVTVTAASLTDYRLPATHDTQDGKYLVYDVSACVTGTTNCTEAKRLTLYPQPSSLNISEPTVANTPWGGSNFGRARFTISPTVAGGYVPDLIFIYRNGVLITPGGVDASDYYGHKYYQYRGDAAGMAAGLSWTISGGVFYDDGVPTGVAANYRAYARYTVPGVGVYWSGEGNSVEAFVGYPISFGDVVGYTSSYTDPYIGSHDLYLGSRAVNNHLGQCIDIFFFGPESDSGYGAFVATNPLFNSGQSGTGEMIDNVSLQRMNYLNGLYGALKNTNYTRALSVLNWQLSAKGDQVARANAVVGALSSSELATRTALAAESATFHGPYQISVSPGTFTTGQPTPVTVTVAAQGRPGVKYNKPILIGLDVSNGPNPGPRTTSTGTATFTVRPDVDGTVRINTTRASVVPPSAAYVSTPAAPAHQRILSAGMMTDIAKGAVDYTSQ